MRLYCTLFLVALLAAGCGGGKYEYVPVTGKVTLGGKPLSGASVQFQPVASSLNSPAGRGSIGKTDDEGQFTLRVSSKQSGAAVAKHRVAISKQLGPIDLVPRRYNSATTLTFEVPPGGTDAANFELTSP